NPATITWVRLRPGDDPTRVVGRYRQADLVLGGSVSAYRRLASAGLLATTGPGNQSSWRVARRPASGSAVDAERVELDDPRRNPATLARAHALLRRGPWSEGYASLVLAAAEAQRIGSLESTHLSDYHNRIERVGVLATSRNRNFALNVLSVFDRPASATDSAEPRDDDDLLADLLGATLVDAQGELWTARDALERAGRPDQAVRWMTEPPPWPPASVEKLKHKSDPDELLSALADQIAFDEDEHAWLLKAWALGPAPLNGDRLADLAEGLDGRLAANPRFRSWLRGEWTAWARQRYRRVARRLAEGRP
ncbi:MAG: hypothetical protein ABI353_24225, partial [Isosphaeraceae bacterium]